MKNSPDTSWDRTSDLPICSTAMILAGQNRSTPRETCPSATFSPHFPHRLACDRFQSSAGRYYAEDESLNPYNSPKNMAVVFVKLLTNTKLDRHLLTKFFFSIFMRYEYLFGQLFICLQTYERTDLQRV